jgi:hypothetical protein
MSSVKPNMLMDTKAFNVDLLKLSIPRAAPKLAHLFQKIKELDAKDMRVHKKQFKHMIFTDISSSTYGAKLIASAFVAHGFVPAFTNNLGLKSDEKLLESKGNNFGLLLSKTFGKKSMSVKMKKAQMHKYNQRPANTQGDMLRFIILDQGFKEGIDLFDVKYVHLFEPLVSAADQKQAIGRSTRFCGQKGLEFHPRFGWPLYVFRYDVKLGKPVEGANTLFELFVKYSDIDFRKVVFASELEKAVVEASVDHELNKEIHSFEIEAPPPILSPNHGGAPKKRVVHKKTKDHKALVVAPPKIMSKDALQSHITEHFKSFAYPRAELENLCDTKAPTSPSGKAAKLTFTPTQDFIRHYFRPESAYKGILLFHSVGSGKTCTAIATATSSFEREGYTILWVTRHTLKADIWKNMYEQICSTVIQEDIDAGKLKLPKKISGPMRYVSDKWMEPISYKQFSNLLQKNNKYYEEIVGRNGEKDPLRKTLVIIDEAHKLYAPNVTGSEKPDTAVLEEMIQNSYKVSGKDSVRVMLMTATPYTEDAMEMMKLLNNLRPEKDALPADFDAFARQYLDTHGYFTPNGKKRFQDAIAGYVSYINRSQDGRQFAHPILENVFVDISPAGKEDPSKHTDNEVKERTQEMKELRGQIKEQKTLLKQLTTGAKGDCKKEAKDKYDACKQRALAAHQVEVEKVKLAKQGALDKCKGVPRDARADCKDAATAKYKSAVEGAKDKKASALAMCADEKKKCSVPSSPEITEIAKTLEDLEKDIDEQKAGREQVKEKLTNFRTTNKERSSQLKELREAAQGVRLEKKDAELLVKDIVAKLKKADTEARVKKLTEDLKAARADVKELVAEANDLKVRITNLTTSKKLDRINIGRGTLGDISQEKALAKRCFGMDIDSP